MGCGLLGPAVPQESSPSPLPVFSGVTVTPTAAHVCMLSHSVMSDSFETPRIVAHQAPPSMEFPRQECWNGLPCPPPRDLPDPVIKPSDPALAGEFFTTAPPVKPNPY